MSITVMSGRKPLSRNNSTPFSPSAADKNSHPFFLMSEPRRLRETILSSTTKQRTLRPGIVGDGGASSGVELAVEGGDE